MCPNGGWEDSYKYYFILAHISYELMHSASAPVMEFIVALYKSISYDCINCIVNVMCLCTNNKAMVDSSLTILYLTANLIFYAR